jgi:hypothetical protein
LDLPGPEQREAIWEAYLGLFALGPRQPRPRDEGWTGAEIRGKLPACSLARRAASGGPAGNVVPVAATAGESLERLRRAGRPAGAS